MGLTIPLTNEISTTRYLVIPRDLKYQCLTSQTCFYIPVYASFICFLLSNELYPNKLKDLQILCQKFKGKRKAELIEVLNANSVMVDYGLSFYGKGELVKKKRNLFKTQSSKVPTLVQLSMVGLFW